MTQFVDEIIETKVKGFTQNNLKIGTCLKSRGFLGL